MKSHHTKIRRGAAILGGLFLIAVWIFFESNSKSSPIYKGRTVAEWFHGLEGHPGLAKNVEKAKIAFNAMGTNCMPYLIERARGNETALNRLYCKLHSDLPVSLKQQIRPAIPATYYQMLAFSYISDLSRNDRRVLDPYMSQLLEIVPAITNNNTRSAAFSLVEGSLDRSQNKTQKINYFLSFSSDPDFRIRLRAMILLSEIDSTITNGIPVLTQATTNKALVRSTVDVQFRRLKFEKVVNDIQKQARTALARIDPHLAKQVEIED